MQRFIIFFLFAIVCSCNDTTTRRERSLNNDSLTGQKINSNTPLQSPTLPGKEPDLQRKEISELEKLDSVKLLEALSKALEIANQNKHKVSFVHEFVSTPDESSYGVTTRLLFGSLFSKGKKHLLIRRQTPWGTSCDILLLENNSFKIVCQRKQEELTYLDDTIKDVNGDRYKDFLVHWYPSSGCCRRDIYNVFLYLPNTGSFTSGYQFINPTFFPKEKVIRGVQYGHPGEVGLYKYKWNGLTVDTVQFVYPDTSSKLKFYITESRDWHKPPIAKSKIVTSLPKEYENITSLDWFLKY